MSGDATYTPRLLVWDLQGSLGQLKTSGRLYDINPPVALPLARSQKMKAIDEDDEYEEEDDDNRTQVLWDGPVQRIEQPKGRKSEYQKHMEQEEFEHDPSDPQPTNALPEDLSEDVMVWADYLRVHLHHKTQTLLPGYFHSDDARPMDMHVSGVEVAKLPNIREDFEDRLHYFMEDCDNAQGFHVISNINDGFVGLTSELLATIRDEYPKKALVMLGVIPTMDNVSVASTRTMNLAFAFETLREHSSLFVPIGLGSSWTAAGTSQRIPGVQNQLSNHYTTSSILGAAVDTYSLAYRLKAAPRNMSSVANLLSYGSLNTVALGTTIAIDMASPDAVMTSLVRPMPSWCTHLMPCLSRVSASLPHIPRLWHAECVLRGVPDAIRTHAGDAVSQFFIQQKLASRVQVETASVGVSQQQPFVQWGETRAPVPMMTSLVNGALLADSIKCLLDDLKKLRPKDVHALIEGGMESSKLSDTVQSMQSLFESYSDS